MALKTTLIAVILAAAPSLSFAMCAAHEMDTSASACADGQVWDQATSACVDQASS